MKTLLVLVACDHSRDFKNFVIERGTPDDGEVWRSSFDQEYAREEVARVVAMLEALGYTVAWSDRAKDYA